jgi:hypothetical protein
VLNTSGGKGGLPTGSVNIGGGGIGGGIVVNIGGGGIGGGIVAYSGM